MNKVLEFPRGFLWGSAISAHQTEGDNLHSDWWEWEHSKTRLEALKEKGLSPADFQSGAACDFYNRYEGDFDLLAQLHQNAFRLSIEWARIEPREGHFVDEEIRHYERVLAALKRRRITTFVTLHHFTLPQWLAEKGGFLKRASTEYFMRYIERVAPRLSPYTDFWLTINEPEIYASHAFLFGIYPPQHKSSLEMYWVTRNLIRAHNHAAVYLRTATSKPVSMAYHLTDLQPINIFAHFSRSLSHYLANEYVLQRTIGTCDYIGVNYYGHSHIGVFGRRLQSLSHHETSDMGWGIHPEGLERVLVDLKKFHKPIYITENGVADAADAKRVRFIKDHLYYAGRAIQRGVDVRGYFYWSLLDNFEWHHGFAPKFGLVKVDYATQNRSIRPSAREYAKIAADNLLIYE